MVTVRKALFDASASYCLKSSVFICRGKCTKNRDGDGGMIRRRTLKLLAGKIQKEALLASY
jgi:hypothetical protein